MSDTQTTDSAPKLGAVAGSLPVSSAEVLDLSRDLLALATKQEQASKEISWDHTPAERAAMARSTRVIEHCAGILRRHVVSANERQPEENNPDEPRE